MKPDLYYLFANALYDAFRTSFGPIIDKSNISKETKPYLLRLYPAVTASILRTWILTGKKESAEKLTSISLHNHIHPSSFGGISEPHI